MLVGTSGGDDGVRGFVAAFDAETGKEGLALLDDSRAGEFGTESWPGDSYLHGGGTTWMPGTYDPELNTFFGGPAIRRQISMERRARATIFIRIACLALDQTRES